MRVLIVDDEPLIAMDLEAMLIGAGHAVVGIAATIPVAISMVAERGCNMVLLDANLDGHSAEPIAQELLIRGIPFIVLSGLNAEELAEAMTKGQFVSKPYRPDALLDVISKIADPCTS
jgi:DNA-binding response OmpR family regulator